MAKNNFDFKQIEEKWRKFWEKEEIYKFNFNSKKKIYSIDTPPPTVSGRMHIGHAFSYSQQDFIARFRRMFDGNVFYPFGTDDNGLPTERLVERSKKIKAKDMSREKFIKLCTDFLKKELPLFIQDWKNIGVSCDFNMYYSTISEYSRKISQESFLDLYNKKRVYRKDAPAMWCPECQTGISQVEAQDKEIESTFNDIVFKVNGKDLIIATTRPELLPACVAVFYHPSDSRFKELKGKKAKVPLFNFEVPIMEDSKVDKEKGTGIVMCCTFGDQTDMFWQKAYNLAIREAINEEGKMTELSKEYEGMGIKEARNTILRDLEKKGLLKKQKKIIHTVNVHERCGTEIEFVKSKQWFVKYLDLKKNMLSWGEKLHWYPTYMKVRYKNWVNGLQWDWLISRQRFFGIPFPVWYCKECGEVMLAEEKDLPIDPLKDKPNKKCKCGSSEFDGEKDVLDTWFTSSMSPRLVTQLLDKKLWDKIFPLNLRPQGHDIITFWLFNTVVKSQLHYNKNPWKDVVISGFVTLKGKKMSKSKGNTIAPQNIIKEYGADALRYWAASSKLGEDMDYVESEVVAGKKFVVKLLNASKFVFMNLKNYRLKKPKKLLETDRLFLSKLNKLIKTCTQTFIKYEYSKSKAEADNFFWKDFADNYIELVKSRVYNGTKEEKESASYTLYNSLLIILKLMAPITPFIAEEIYQNYFRKNEKDKSIHISQWPKGIKIKENKSDENDWMEMIGVIKKIRQKKSDAKKSVNAEIKLSLEKNDFDAIAKIESDFKQMLSIISLDKGKFNVEFQ